MVFGTPDGADPTRSTPQNSNTFGKRKKPPVDGGPQDASPHVQGWDADRIAQRFGEGGREVEGIKLTLRQRLMEGEPVPEGFSLDRAQREMESVSALSDIGRFTFSPPIIWSLECDSAQTHRLIAAAGTATATVAGAIAMLVPPAAPVAGLVALKIGSVIGAIETINLLGGNNGVVITGIIGAEGLIIVPRGLGPALSLLAEAARLAVSGKTVLEWVIAAAAYSPVLSQGLAMSGVATVFNAITAGTPLGWALSLGAGIVLDELFGSEPDPNARGHVVADRTAVGPWESFLMSREGADGVMLLSHMGLFSADGGGGKGVYANRPAAGPWERWTLIDHRDGTVSLRSVGGHYFVAENGGGSVCNANRTAIGAWERFRLEYHPQGKVALRASGGHYVSVLP